MIILRHVQGIENGAKPKQRTIYDSQGIEDVRLRRTFYDEAAAEHYDEFKLRGYYEYEEDAKSMGRIIRQRVRIMDDRVLEIGVGTANFAMAVVDQSGPKVKVDGIDNSQSMLGKYRGDKKRRYGQDIRIFNQRVETMGGSGLKSAYPICISHGFMMWIADETGNDWDFSSYIYNINDHVKAFRRIADHLDEGGLFLINIFGHGGGYHEPQEIPLGKRRVYRSKGIKRYSNPNIIGKIHVKEDETGKEIWRGIWPRSRYSRESIERELRSFFDINPQNGNGFQPDGKFYVAQKT